MTNGDRGELMLGSMTAFVTSYSQSDFFGKMIILSLVGLSVLCWIVLIHKVWMIRKVRGISIAFQQAFAQNKDSILNLNIDAYPKPKHAATPHPFAQILQSLKHKSVEVLNKNHHFKGNVYLTPTDLEFLESHVISTISEQTKILEKNIYILSTIVTLAPFVGLLGTVWGILVTFSGLHDGSSMTSNASFLGGLSTALATTVLGLIIAIPAVIAYNYLKNALRHYSSDMHDFLTSAMSTLELQYRKVE